MNERNYWLGFSSFPGIGPQRFSLLVNYFGSVETTWKAAKADLLEAKLGDKMTEKFLVFRESFDFGKYLEELGKKQVSFITLQDSEYPEKLKQIPNAPFLLYLKGNKQLLCHKEDSILPVGRQVAALQNDSNKYIAVVGTRRITSYGQTVTRLFSESLVHAGCVIVSGLALGVDAVAHQTTLDTHGKTIAVLGCGVDCCSPSENQKLYNSILEKGGAIISEFPLSAKPTIGSFPSRNRIVAGLSDAVVVTEGAEDSGALITADFALQYGRKAFAIPGNITSTLSKGPYKLLKKGGVLVTSPEELLGEIGVSKMQSLKVSKLIKGETEDEQKIINLLLQESLMIDQLIKQTGIVSSKMSALLSLMEIKSMILLKNGYYSIL